MKRGVLQIVYGLLASRDIGAAQPSARDPRPVFIEIGPAIHSQSKRVLIQKSGQVIVSEIPQNRRGHDTKTLLSPIEFSLNA